MTLQTAPVQPHEPDAYQQFMADWGARVKQTGYWEPPVTPKQRSIVGFKERFVLLAGPRHSIKTVGGLHAIADHCWNIPDASVAFVAISQTNATDSGAWKDLCDTVMPAWIAGDFGMTWKEEPRFSTYSHKAFFEVTNQWGAAARVQIFSVPNERDIEDLFKNKSFTMIFITELSKFRQQKTFVTLKETLRGIGRPDSHFKFLADTNPAEEGTASWIWRLWFAPLLKSPEERNNYENQFKVLQFTIDDNPFYSTERKEEIRKSYEYDQNEYARNVKGEWVVSSEGSFFAEQFRYGIHVVPSESAHPDEYLTVIENPSLSEMTTGSDIGTGINHAAHIIEKYTDENGEVAFKILDEIISVGLAVGIGDFTKMWMQRIDFWEQVCGRKVMWRHWSDSDIFNFDAGAKEYKHKIVYAASEGKIELRKVSKGPFSVAPRFNLIKKLLHDNRLHISKRCPRTIDALQTIKIEKRKSAGPVDPRDPKKHPIDSFSYALYMEVGEDAMNQARLATRRDSERSGTGLVHVPI